MDYAFQRCYNLKSITIPESITYINSTAFSYCSSLTRVTWNVKRYNNNDNYAFFDRRDPIQEFIFGDEVEYIPPYLCSYMDSLKSIIIPDNVLTIGNNAFNSCPNLASVTIGNTVRSIESRAFSYCSSLNNITIPESVTNIGESAFSYCSNIVNVVIPNGVDSVGTSAFAGCTNLKSFVCAGVPIFGENVLQSCQQLHYVKSGGGALEYTANQQLDSYTTLLDSVIITHGTLSEKGFDILLRSKKRLKLLDMEQADNMEVNDEALTGCFQLKRLVLPKNLMRIGYKAVSECVALKAISIPAAIEEISDRAFEDCRSIQSITFASAVRKVLLGMHLLSIANYSASVIGHFIIAMNCRI